MESEAHASERQRVVFSDRKAKEKNFEVDWMLYRPISKEIKAKMGAWARSVFCKGRCMAGNFMLTIQWHFGRSSTVDYYVTTYSVFSTTGDFYVCHCSDMERHVSELQCFWVLIL